jgi:hypothetical protein
MSVSPYLHGSKYVVKITPRTRLIHSLLSFREIMDNRDKKRSSLSGSRVLGSGIPEFLIFTTMRTLRQEHGDTIRGG